MIFGIAEAASFHGKEFIIEDVEYAESTEKNKPDRLPTGSGSSIRVNAGHRETAQRTQTGKKADRLKPILLAGEAVFFRIKQLGETRVFLEERKIFVVAGVVAVFRAQVNCHLQIGKRGIGFTGEAIERGQRVMNVVRLGRRFAGFVETFSRIVPAADVHHRNTSLIMFFGSARILLVRRFHALLGDFHVHARAIREFLAGTFENFFKFLLGAREFLLMEERESLIVKFELRLDERVHQLDTPTLRWWRRA